jgi:hypothetical protein
MNEELQKIHDKLIKCKLGDAVRVSLINQNTDFQCLVCFLLLTDRFTNFEDLLLAIRNCLQEFPVIISEINNSTITIMPDKTK